MAINSVGEEKIRVLIVDDSAFIRRLMTDILAADPELEVVGSAADAFQARDMIKSLNPDVLTLDVEMPGMDGIQFLSNLMRLRPMPVVMCSTLTEHGADVTLEALELGAVDFVQKPTAFNNVVLAEYKADVAAKVKAAACATVRGRTSPPPRRPAATAEIPTVAEKYSADVILPKVAPRPMSPSEILVAIGASTGGTEAIRHVLCQMPADSPAIVVTQHIPKAFSGPFAKRMDQCCALAVSEALDGEPVLRGHVYIAPGDQHLLVVREGSRYRLRLSDGPPVQRHKPSVDVLFRSVAQAAGPSAVGVMLTGMGRDGAQCMLEMREAGATNIAQDEATSVVWGMPGAAYETGAVHELQPLEQIATRILRLAEAQGRPRRAS
jgi:two-component system, chemotaxis family, protein-glutamate methylesterase/glutaminase